MIDCGERAEALRQPSHSIIGSHRVNDSGPAFSVHAIQIRVFASFHIRKINIRGHSGAQSIVVIRQPDLHAEHLSDAVFNCLDVARRKFSLSIDLLDDAREIFARKRIDPDADLFAKFDHAEPGFWNVNAHPKMLRQKQRRDFAIRRQARRRLSR